MVASYEREDVAFPSTLTVVAHKVGAAPHPIFSHSCWYKTFMVTIVGASQPNTSNVRATSEMIPRLVDL